MRKSDRTNRSILIRLGDRGQTVADPAEDVRGPHVIGINGTKVGRIADLLIDTQDRKVRFLRVELGGVLGFGATITFIPVEAIGRITGDQVFIHQSSAHISDQPRYDPEIVDQMPYYAGLYDYYGYLSFWAPGSPSPGTHDR